MLNYESEPRTALIDVIRQVRQRWRLKQAVRGAVGFLAATILALVASAYALEALKFTPGAIITFRVALLLAAAGLAAWFLVRPLLRKVSDEQVALYLEEHEIDPDHIRAAVDAGADEYVMKPFDRDTLESKLQIVGVL